MLALIACCALGGEDGRFFERRDVDFWESHRRAAAPEAELWSDSAAPPPVKRLLEKPGPETARSYLAWQEERFRRLRAAIGAVEAVQRGAAPKGPLLYFSREGCRWCALQEEELRGLDVVRVPPGSPLWAEFGVTMTPTLVIDGKVLRGLTPRETLLKELRHE
ncbi:MAG: hypothetical protein JO332_07720 [Planctomycetaceae bacterium]|nr:hypothetical protein [Planctomycetaceae bacterium]